MIRLLTLAVVLMTAACTVPVYDPEPTSVEQWQNRQERIEREQAERQRLCAGPDRAEQANNRACDARPGDH